MQIRKSLRAGTTALMAAVLAASGILLTAPLAHAEAGDQAPELAVEVTEVPNEKIIIDVQGAGYSDATETSGEMNLGLFEKDGALTAQASVTATVAENGELAELSEPLEEAVTKLDEAKQYEVIAWPADIAPASENLYARADTDIDWSLLSPPGDESEQSDEATENTTEVSENDDSAVSSDSAQDSAQERGSQATSTASANSAKSIEVTIEEVPDEKIVIGVTGTGFGDVPKLPGQDVPHAYLAFVPKGIDLSTIGQDSNWPNVSADVEPDGTLGGFSGAFEMDIDELNRSQEYEVISWPSRSNPTEETLYTRADADINWNALFPVPDGDGPRIVVNTTEVADERVDFNISGEGFEDVVALPGQDEPHVYFTLIEKDTDLSEISQGDSDAAISATVAEDGSVNDVLSVPVEALDRTKSYEIISWPSRSNPTDENLYTRADVDIDWDKLFPADAPRIIATVTDANESSGLTVKITGENIRILEDESASGATVAVAERGKKISGSGDAAKTDWVPKGAVSDDGEFELELKLPKSSLDRYAQYEVALFKNTDFNQRIASSNFVVSEAQWTALFGKALPATVTVDRVSVVSAGLNIDVSAKNLPGSHLYVAIIERGTEANLTQDGGYADFLYQPPVKNGAGKFNFVVSKNALNRNKQYEVLIWRSHSNPDSSTIYGRADINVTSAQWDALANTTPETREPKRPKPSSRGGSAQAGSLTWGISSGFADYTTNKNRAGGKSGGKILTSGVGGGRGGWIFPQASGGNWNKASQTGTVRFSGVVTFTAHKGLMNESFANPVITVTNDSSGTISAGGSSFRLNLASATKSVGPNGEVTWRNVPVAGAISGGGGGGGGSIPVDPLTFTVGAASSTNYGATAAGPGTDEKKYTPAATPPTTEGLEILTPAEKLVPGGRIEIQARGFDPEDENVLVVLYSDPVVLDDTAKADGSGLVQWSGTLPKDVELGEHVLTLQGSNNAGAVIEIVEEKERKHAGAASSLETGVSAQAAVAGLGAFSPNGMALWEWWASAAGLAAIAACTTTVALRQRNGL
ncbi:MAG: HtaA domain-containing protein [Leucobacter sp.]